MVLVEFFLYEYFKDAWYIFNPVLVMLTGYVLYSMKPDLGRGLRAFVIAGLLVALWQLRGYAIEPSLIELPAGQIRASSALALTCRWWDS